MLLRDANRQSRTLFPFGNMAEKDGGISIHINKGNTKTRFKKDEHLITMNSDVEGCNNPSNEVYRIQERELSDTVRLIQDKYDITATT